LSGGFTFVHTADLHLDSQFRGLEQAFLNGEKVPEGVLRRLRNCTFEAFERIVDLCIERKADFLLLAGDVYDAADKSLRAQIRFREGLARLASAGIATFVVHGNHDHCAGWRAGLEFSNTVHVFSDREVEFRPFVRNGREIARIYGISYPGRMVVENYADRFKRNKDAPFAVALLHCNVDGIAGHENYAPCRLSDLLNRGFDYWALGHVHSRLVLNPEGPCVAYPGCPQGRRPGEGGERGCLVVNVSDSGKVSLEFVPVGPVRWEALELSIEGLGSDQGLVNRLLGGLRGMRKETGGKPVVVRITLTGRGALHRYLNRPSYIADLIREVRDLLPRGEEDFIYLESIRAATGVEVDLDELARSDTLLGDLLGLAGRARGDGELRTELRRALAPLLEHPGAGKHLEPPGEEELDRLLERAGEMAVDLLME